MPEPNLPASSFTASRRNRRSSPNAGRGRLMYLTSLPCRIGVRPVAAPNGHRTFWLLGTQTGRNSARRTSAGYGESGSSSAGALNGGLRPLRVQVPPAPARSGDQLSRGSSGPDRVGCDSPLVRRSSQAQAGPTGSRRMPDCGFSRRTGGSGRTNHGKSTFWVLEH